MFRLQYHFRLRTRILSNTTFRMASTATETATTSAASASGADAVAPPPLKQKLHGRAFYESIGSPKYIVAPMVDQSEFAWRMLIRSFLPPDKRASILAYSPMLHARLFEDSPKYRESHFEAVQDDHSTSSPTPHLDGNPGIDRPLFVQFCANDASALLGAAQRVAPYCDAVDLNLGCPQGIARKGKYGAFLQEEPALIAQLVRTLHETLAVPVTAKIRVLETKEKTLAYAQTVLEAGASILTVHGRQRAQKGHLTGLADWTVLRYLREQLPPETVLFANGNVLQQGDLQRCLDATGFDGVMSAEGLLSDPGLFAEMPGPATVTPSETDTTTNNNENKYWWPTPDPEREYWRSKDGRRGGWRVDAIMRRYLDLLHVYVRGEAAPPSRKPLFLRGDAVPEEPAAPPESEDNSGRKRKRDQPVHKESSSSPNLVGVQAHLFHVLRHAVSKHHDVRDLLGRSRKGDLAGYERILAMLERRVALAMEAGEDEEFNHEEEAEVEVEEIIDDPESSERARRRCRRPWWVAQAVIRPMPAEALAKGAIKLKKTKEDKDKKEA